MDTLAGGRTQSSSQPPLGTSPYPGHRSSEEGQLEIIFYDVTVTKGHQDALTWTPS